ncbi:hypothetical protein RsTz2092_10680 [Deferribacterales bacterium RsTz2092]|nr:hypothetical protein AGMMS49941_08990 [Deferribacterales bacterium]
MKFIRFIGVLGLFLVGAYTARLVYRGNPAKRGAKLAALTHIASVRMMKLFNVKINVVGDIACLTDGAPCLLLANHQSYIDILFISSIRPTLFLSHIGIQREPVIGTLAECGGTLFVDNTTIAHVRQEMERFATMLKDGNMITLFPEGHTYSGDRIMPFHASFINAAILADGDVLPICIHYDRYNGEPITLANRDKICCYGDMPFLPHIANVYKEMKSAEITITIASRIKTAYKSRKEIADEAKNWMTKTFKPYR